MKIADLIGEDRVVVGLRAPDKTQLLQDLAGRAATALSMDRRKIFENPAASPRWRRPKRPFGFAILIFKWRFGGTRDRGLCSFA